MIPTIGRKTLTQTLASIMPQIRERDEIVVVHDTSFPDAKYSNVRTGRQQRRAPVADCWVTFCICDHGEEGQGYLPRMEGVRFLNGRTDLLCFMDDDDIYTDGALDLMRTSSLEHPTIFRMFDPNEGLIWRTKNVGFGNIGTPMFVVPNRPKQLGRWKAHTVMDGTPVGGDFTFVTETIEKMGGDVEWRKDVIAHLRPTPPQ